MKRLIWICVIVLLAVGALAQNHWQTARQNQIASLQNYWLAYYHLRRLTLFDYQRHQPISN